MSETNAMNRFDRWGDEEKKLCKDITKLARRRPTFVISTLLAYAWDLCSDDGDDPSEIIDTLRKDLKMKKVNWDD